MALLSDTLHNLADAMTAIRLWIAFSLGRRRPTRAYTYGFNRAEDIAGLLVVAPIGASAVLVIWESVLCPSSRSRIELSFQPPLRGWSK